MVGKKRRKASAASGKVSAKRKTGTSTTTTTSSTEPPIINVCTPLLRHLLDIASSKSRAANVLQTFCDGKCWTDIKQIPAGATVTVETTGSNFDCYWIILATNIMNRLLVLEDEAGEKNSVIVTFVTALADAVTTILLSDKSILTANQMANDSRSTLCRAILTTTLAASYGIRNYNPQQETQQKHDTYEAAVATLDRLVYLRTGSSAHGTAHGNNSISRSEEKESRNDCDSSVLQTAGKWILSTLKDECAQIEELLGLPFENSENDCVNILLETSEIVSGAEEEEAEKPASTSTKRSTRTQGGGGTQSNPTLTKRKASAKKQTTSAETEEDAHASMPQCIDIDPSPIVAAFENLLASEDFGKRIDGRVAIKRWASIAVVWSQRGEGQRFILREIHKLAADKEYDNLLTPFEKSRLMSTMMYVVIETGNQCGVRAPTGGIEQYLASITPGTGTVRTKPSESGKPKRTKQGEDGEPNSPGSSNPLGRKNNNMRRADIRDWTTVVIHDFVQNHKKCLLETAESTQGEEENGVRDPPAVSHTFSVSNFSDLVMGLCRTASSSVQNSNYTEQNSWNKALMSIASVFCLELAVDPSLPLDAKMISFALSHFVDSLQMIDSHSTIGVMSSCRVSVEDGSSSVSEKQKRDFETKFLLRTRLPTPIVPSISTPTSTSSDTKLASAKNSTFAGLISNGDSFTDEHAIALAIRALQMPGRRGDTSPAAGKLLTFLVDLVRRAYDTRKPKAMAKSQLQSEKTENTLSTGKRKRADKGSSTNRRSGRRRKTESGEAQQVKEQDNLVWNQITPQMISVAIPALNAIRICLMNTKRRGSCTIRKVIRSMVTIDHMLNLVELGEMLDRIVIKTRCRTNNLESNFDASTPKSSTLAYTRQGEYFTGAEILLWKAHMNMCHVLGRGQLTYEVNSGLDPLIWDSDRRKEMYKALTSALDATGSGGAKNKKSFSLPGANHALLVANMSCVSDEENRDPERGIVNSYIDLINIVFDNLETLTPKKYDSGDRILDDDIPLSYNDARTLMLALNRLPYEMKHSFFERLVKSVLDALQLIMKNKAKRESVSQNAEASGFLARVLVVCHSLMNSIVMGKELQQVFLSNMGCAQIRMPSFITRADWYCQDRTFMGLFNTWESSSLPENITGNRNEQTLLSKKASDEFRSLLETAFAMGFDAAPHDHCHLLFTVWNGLDQIPGSSSREGFSPTLMTIDEDYSNKILQLREDVCSVYKAISIGEHVDLREMIFRASELAATLLDNYIPDDEEMKQDIPLPVMVLLASIPTYISAAVAGHTKPGNDYFSTTLSKSSTSKHKRRRGYSSDSDHLTSDCESDEDVDDYENEARIDAMSRLRECCDAFGAAPIHPDWLDVSCSLRDGIRPSDAIAVAEKAMKTLSRLATVAFTQYKRHQSWAFQALNNEHKDVEQCANLYSTILQWSRHEIGPSQYPNCREWQGDIATLTKLSQKGIDYLSEDVHARDIEQTKACWCPHAGQRLRGFLQEENKLMGGWETSDAELRAGGEWELLLAKSLSIACLNTNQSEDSIRKENMEDYSEVAPLNDKKITSEMAKVQLWRTVFMSATSHLVPAAALLRLGLGKVGRKPHPFAFHENEQDPYDAAPLHFSERLNGIESSISSSSKTSVHETLCLLARLSIEAEESLSIVCHAVASHLVVDSNTFLDLEGMHSTRCAFMGLDLIREITKSSPKKDAKTLIPFVVERLVSMIEDSGRGDNVVVTEDTKASTKYRRLHHFLGDPNVYLVDTIATKSIDIFKILKAGRFKELCEDQVQPYKWSHALSKENAVSDLISILCEDSLRANGRTRCHIALILSRLGLLESQSIINSMTMKQPLAVSAMIKAFTKVDKKHLKSVILKDLCGIRGSKPPSKTFRINMASIFSLLLFSQSTPKFDKAKFIHDTLMTALDSWKKIDRSHRDLTLNVLLMYGAFFNSLFEIGSKLVKHTERVGTDDEPNGEAELFSSYFASIKRLQSFLSKKDTVLPKTSKMALKSSSTGLSTTHITIPSEFPRSCSFIKRSGFHGQHWYHCYTCNLVNDKGCCSLCALVCHRDHDVAYSRHSSFFCDCAAEDGNSAEQSRVSCKCLSSIPANQLDAIYQNEQIEGWGPKTKSNDGSELKNTDCIFEENILEIVKYSFAGTALKSVNKFLLDIKDSQWLDSLFSVVDKEFKNWKTQYGDSIRSLLKEFSEASLDSTLILRLSHESVQRRLRQRRSKPLELGKLEEKGLVPVRVATGFVAKFSSDSSTHDALTLARLSRNDVSRSILALDSRGRMILAEPSSLVFCSPMAAVNVRNSRKSEDEHITRSQMCILGSASLSFNVVGVRLCAENERHVVVWGTSEACVLVLKTDYSGVEDTINLTFEVDDQERDGDVLVNCEWLPGSQTHVAVGVSRYVRLFDVCRFETNGNTKRAHPVIGYNLGFEASLRDLSIVSQKECATSEGDNAESLSNYRAEHISKMFLLLENGRLHSLEIKISNGKIESPSELHFEPSECVSISTEGIRPRSTSSVGLSGASTRTLGEGSKLVYLKQSRCLLYKCKSAAVVALMLGNDGNVEGTFELLPHTIPISVLGTYDEDDMYSISGPYTLWTELGMVYRKGENFFRVVCLGRATRSGHSRLLCIDFNEKKTKITEISCSLGLGLNLDSFEGLAAFTAPVVQANTLSNRYMTGERTFLCALTSEGNLQIFGDDLIDMSPTSVGPNGFVLPTNPVELTNISEIQSTAIKKFPLTIFEQLTNVSESENLIFSGEGLGFDSKELKSRLARDTSSSFVCPRREGCCLTISLLQHIDTVSRSKASANPQDLVISAIRVLVGSTCDHIPSKISVQGRSIDITPRLKRWYNVPLTEEEIARGIRTGLVSLRIGESFDPTNGSVIDSVEVFASERNSMVMALPRSYFASTLMPSLEESPKFGNGASNTNVFREEKTSSLEDDRATSSSLVLSVRATTNLCKFICPTVRISDEGKELMRQLVQNTAVHPDKLLGKSLQVLSGSLDSDGRSRWSFQDENMLVGCSRALDECNDLLNDPATCIEGKIIASENLKWKVIRIILQDCLNVSSLIARERPNNYLQSMGNMQENNLKSGSIAIEASKLILEGLKKSTGFEELIGGTRGIITLSLTEMAIVVYMDDSKSTKDFVQLSQIREFLDVANLSSCEAISTFFQDHESEQKKSSIPDLFVQMEAARRVAYQCDSCGICPMKEVRYTILEEDYGIDLCNKCYEVGKKFASSKKHKSSAEVIINGKSMGGNLTCAHMKKMEPVSLEKMEMDVEQLDVETIHPKALIGSEGSVDEDEELQKALKLSLGESVSDISQQDLSADHRGYEYFLGELYSFVMEQLSCAFRKDRCDSSMESLIKLALDLVRHSKRDSLKYERAVWFVRDVSKGIRNILSSSVQKQKLTHCRMSTLVTCLRGLSSLTTPDSDFEYNFPGSKSDAIYSHQAQSNETKKPKLTCVMHGIPAVRRRCDKPGVNKDRRFYVCGKEKGQRCNYFKWADDGPKKKEQSMPKSQFYQIVQSAMLDCYSSSDENLYDRICMLLEEELFGEDGGLYEVSVLASNHKEKKTEGSLLKSFYSVENMERDFNDGVFCSKEKLLDVMSSEALVKTKAVGTHELSLPVRVAGDRGALLLEASLDLLTLIADHKTDGISRWFSILCEITMSTNKHSSLRSLATKVLKTLCGGNRKKYHYIRDHFTFCFQLKRLYHFSHSILESALIVKEKTRQCSVDWKSPAVDWATLSVGGLVGTQDLISEDDVTELNLKGCGKALDDLWTVIKSRGGSWRQFCGFRSLPLSQRHSANSDSKLKEHTTEQHLFEAPPIKVLFWIASSLSGINQVKALRMIDFALFDWKGKKTSLKAGIGNPDEGSNHDKYSDDDRVHGIGSTISKPEELLLKSGTTKLVVDDVIAISLNMVHSGKTSELRRVAYQIVLKLSRAMSDDDRLFLFQNLLTAVGDIGMLGKAGVEFLNLLQTLAHFLIPSASIGSLADFVVDSFIQQLDAINYDKSNSEWAVLETNVGSSVARKKFDLSGCLFCLKLQHNLGGRESARKSSERRHLSNSGRASARGGSTSVAGRSGATTPRQKWHSEQISPFSRCRLDSQKDNCTSNEFNLFYKLKSRVSISDIHLTVSEPRGRYVKTVSIFFISRPVSGSLKSNNYSLKWQKIATLNLARGGSCASVSLSQPIVAANIRVEFTEFYERPGNKDRGTDGPVVLHCPRCTRPVTNAHGVCATCGEVAFQCRKCRHINYDRLDAFLCVECGYTCCGTFSIELNSAVVSNAIAITDDTVFDKSIEMYGTSSSIQEGLKEKLGEKLRSLSQNKLKNHTERESFFDTAIERAFLGLLPADDENEDGKGSQKTSLLDRFDKQGSVVKYVAHPENDFGGSGRSSSTTDRSERARSLLRLARQIRSESSSSSDRRRSTDIIIRHLGRVENLEDILGSGNNGTTRANDQDSGDKEPKDKEKIQKAEAEDCQKMLILLREAWRESYELRRRIDAWKCLNSGALVRFSPLDLRKDRSLSFSPSHCSVCGGSVALQILVLWLKLFLVAPAEVHVGEEFFGTLFQEDIPISQCKGLQEIKKQVIISIATNSRNGAEMVLTELRKRLAASHDMNCADILGKIMEIEGFGMADEYAKLAMDILSSQGDLAVSMQV